MGGCLLHSHFVNVQVEHLNMRTFEYYNICILAYLNMKTKEEQEQEQED